MNLKMVSSVGTTLVAAMEKNLSKLNRQVVDLQAKLAASKKIVVQVQNESQALCMNHSSTKKLEEYIQEEVTILEYFMDLFYQEMMNLQ